MKNPDWEELRNEFPAVKNYIYFNNAGIAPVSVRLKNMINECMDKFCSFGALGFRDCLSSIDRTRTLSAELINSKPAEIAFVKNTTQGIQIAANGIRWKKGDNVIIPDNEFPANVFPWLNLAERGVEVRFLPVKNGVFTVEDIVKYIDKRTRAVSLSAVSFTNGFRCDLDKIGQLCEDKGVYFIVDAIQALGAMEVDVVKSKIDLLAATAHKWLLGPQGTGILYVSDRILNELDVSNLGYNSMSDESDYLNYNIRLKPDASRFEEGTFNTFGIIGLKASLEMILSAGIPAIEKRIRELTDILIKKITDEGYKLKSPLNPGERSGILSFYHDGIDTDQIYKKLSARNVVCAVRDGAVRISPHFYNNLNDVEAFTEALK